jgi:Abortive infection C-terminus
MSLELDDVRAWLIELQQFEAASILAECEFEPLYVDTAMRMDTEFGDIDIYELTIRTPPKYYRELSGRYKVQREQIEAAVSELTAHTTGSYIRETRWSLKIPNLSDVESTPDAELIFSDPHLSDIQRLWTKAKARILSDPDGAITAARSMLESLCKTVITENGDSYNSKDDLPQLYRKAQTYIALAPGAQTEEEYKKMSGACTQIIFTLTCIRNRESDAHASVHKTTSAHARFVVNLAGSMATFIIQTKKR